MTNDFFLGHFFFVDVSDPPLFFEPRFLNLGKIFRTHPPLCVVSPGYSVVWLFVFHFYPTFFTGFPPLPPSMHRVSPLYEIFGFGRGIFSLPHPPSFFDSLPSFRELLGF